MKRFARVLQELMNENELTQVEVSNLSSIQQTKISRLLRGHTRVDQEDLSALFSAFTDRQARFRLATAHIQDELPVEAVKHIEIQSTREQLSDAPPFLPQNLSPRLTQAISFLLNELQDNASIADVLIDLAHALGWDELPPQPPGKVKYPANKARATRGSATSYTDTALEILKKGHPGHDVPPKPSR